MPPLLWQLPFAANFDAVARCSSQNARELLKLVALLQ